MFGAPEHIVHHRETKKIKINIKDVIPVIVIVVIAVLTALRLFDVI